MDIWQEEPLFVEWGFVIIYFSYRSRRRQCSRGSAVIEIVARCQFPLLAVPWPILLRGASDDAKETANAFSFQFRESLSPHARASWRVRKRFPRALWGRLRLTLTLRHSDFLTEKRREQCSRNKANGWWKPLPWGSNRRLRQSPRIPWKKPSYSSDVPPRTAALLPSCTNSSKWTLHKRCHLPTEL